MYIQVCIYIYYYMYVYSCACVCVCVCVCVCACVFQEENMVIRKQDKIRLKVSLCRPSD